MISIHGVHSYQWSAPTHSDPIVSLHSADTEGINKSKATDTFNNGTPIVRPSKLYFMLQNILQYFASILIFAVQILLIEYDADVDVEYCDFSIYSLKLQAESLGIE